jgi:hypothetical protein
MDETGELFAIGCTRPPRDRMHPTTTRTDPTIRGTQPCHPPGILRCPPILLPGAECGARHSRRPVRAPLHRPGDGRARLATATIGARRRRVSRAAAAVPHGQATGGLPHHALPSGHTGTSAPAHLPVGRTGRAGRVGRGLCRRRGRAAHRRGPRPNPQPARPPRSGRSPRLPRSRCDSAPPRSPPFSERAAMRWAAPLSAMATVATRNNHTTDDKGIA